MSLSRFMKDRRGGVAPMFAIAIIPVLGLVGAAVDYSRANSVRAGLQSALDATSLAMAKLAPTLTQSELQQKTTAYFNAMFNHPEAKNLVITPAYSTSGGSQLTITASGTMDTTFMRVMGFNSLNIGSNVTVKWGNNRLRVALALDNTGSMDSDGKIGALKTATKNLLDSAQDRRHEQRRRLCVDRSVQQERECRNVDLYQCDLGRLGRLGGRQRSRPVDHELLQPEERQERQVEEEVLDHDDVGSGQSQHLERLHHRPRQGIRRSGHGADQRHRDQVPGRAVRQVPCAGDGPELRLEQA